MGALAELAPCSLFTAAKKDWLVKPEDDVDRTGCAIDIVCQAIIGGEHYFDDHKFILNEAGKQYRKTRKEIFIKDGCWEEFQEDYIEYKKLKK